MALPLERMSSKERMTSREKNVVVQPSKRSLRRRMRRWDRKESLGSWSRSASLCLYSSSIDPLIRAVGPGSRHLTGEKEEGPRNRAVVGILRWVMMAHRAGPSSQTMAAVFL